MNGPCRCLIAEMPDQAELARIIRERIETLPEEERTPEAEYAFRLSRCRECGHLVNGTCDQCGCYAEIRAARKWQKCPDTPARWQAIHDPLFSVNGTDQGAAQTISPDLQM